MLYLLIIKYILLKNDAHDGLSSLPMEFIHIWYAGKLYLV